VIRIAVYDVSEASRKAARSGLAMELDSFVGHVDDMPLTEGARCATH
jgi:hypothetical protein